MSTYLSLSEQDKQDLLALASTEVSHHLARSNPTEYKRQIAGVIDTVLNRVASPQFPDTVREVANQHRQFSKITGPANLDPYGDVSKVPQSSIPQGFLDVANEHIQDRLSGAESVVGGNLHYANSNYITPNNQGWVSKLDGPTFGQGQAKHTHGTTKGFQPIEAILGAPTPAAPINRPTALDAVNQFAGDVPATQTAYAPQADAQTITTAQAQNQSLADALALNTGLMQKYGAIPSTFVEGPSADQLSSNVFGSPSPPSAPPIPAGVDEMMAARSQDYLAPSSATQVQTPSIAYNPQVPIDLMAPQVNNAVDAVTAMGEAQISPESLSETVFSGFNPITQVGGDSVTYGDGTVQSFGPPPSLYGSENYTPSPLDTVLPDSLSDYEQLAATDGQVMTAQGDLVTQGTPNVPTTAQVPMPTAMPAIPQVPQPQMGLMGLFGDMGKMGGLLNMLGNSGPRPPMDKQTAMGVMNGIMPKGTYGSNVEYSNYGTAKVASKNAFDRLRENRAKREAQTALGL